MKTQQLLMHFCTMATSRLSPSTFTRVMEIMDTFMKGFDEDVADGVRRALEEPESLLSGAPPKTLLLRIISALQALVNFSDAEYEAVCELLLEFKEKYEHQVDF